MTEHTFRPSGKCYEGRITCELQASTIPTACNAVSGKQNSVVT
jgi:hypothetical protein